MAMEPTGPGFGSEAATAQDLKQKPPGSPVTPRGASGAAALGLVASRYLRPGTGWPGISKTVVRKKLGLTLPLVQRRTSGKPSKESLPAANLMANGCPGSNANSDGRAIHARAATLQRQRVQLPVRFRCGLRACALLGRAGLPLSGIPRARAALPLSGSMFSKRCGTRACRRSVSTRQARLSESATCLQFFRRWP